MKTTNVFSYPSLINNLAVVCKKVIILSLFSLALICTAVCAFAEDDIASAKALAISAPRVEYPYEARAKGITGSGFYILHLNPQGGVASVQIVHSSGHRILDREAVSTLKRWRFKPGPKKVRLPVTWTLP